MPQIALKPDTKQSGSEFERQAERPIPESRNAGTGTEEACYRLSGERAFSSPTHQTSLHKRRWLHRHDVSGDQRYYLIR